MCRTHAKCLRVEVSAEYSKEWWAFVHVQSTWRAIHIASHLAWNARRYMYIVSAGGGMFTLLLGGAVVVMNSNAHEGQLHKVHAPQ